MKKHLRLNWTFFCSVSIALIALPFGLVQAVDTSIVVDNTLPQAITTLPAPVPDPNSKTGGIIHSINENNGQAFGSNLFYSFSQFNIGASDTAEFNLDPNQIPNLNPNPAPASWENVIARVTGGAVSFIDGTLKVTGDRTVDATTGATTITNGAQKFFFINPSGITFGPKSVVDVPGSFYASTASTLNFSDGSSYRSDGTQPSGLSAAAPVSFGFLGNETGVLTLNNATVQVFNDETLALVGRDITIDNDSKVGQVDLMTNDRSYAKNPLFIDGVQLLLLATHSKTNVPINVLSLQSTTASDNQLDGNINIKNSDLINAGGDAEEITFLRGGNITLENASIVSSNYGDDCGGFCGDPTLIGEPAAQVSGIDILAKGALTLNNGHIVTETVFSPVNPTDNNVAITVQANSLSMDNGSTISSKSLNIERITPKYIPTGIIPVFRAINPKAGDISINVGADFVVKGGSSIESSTETFGNAGEIRLTASSITLDNASIKSESLSVTNGLTGYVNDGNGIKFVKNNTYKTQQSFYLDSIFKNSKLKPPISPSSLNLYVNAALPPPLEEIQYNAGDAGKITLTATNGDIKLTNGSTVSTDIHSGTVNSGTAEIKLTANSGAINMNGATVSSTTRGDANAGAITLSASSPLQMSNNAKISTDSLGVNGSKLGDSGAISITSQAATIDTGSVISSSSKSLGSAGTIALNTTSSITLANGSAISTDVQNASKNSLPAKIAISSQSGAITMDGATISSTTSGDANAGDITLSAREALQMSNNAKITTDSSGAKLGNSGAIAVNAKALTMNAGVISSSSKSLGGAGQITVSTPDAIALANSSISTDVQNGTPSSQTGKIALNAQAGAITMDGSTVSSTTSGDANAGDITLSASEALQMSNNSKITTDSLGNGSKLGNSGIISIASKNLNMNNGSLISSSTNSLGSAGTVSINTGILSIRGLGNIPINQLGHYVEPNFTGIRSTANSGSGGQTGFIDITARNNMLLTEGAQISISNQATVGNPRALVPTYINILTPNLYMTNSQIVADSGGNVDAGNISITFTDWLEMENRSAISTLANNGNAGNIVIKGGDMFWLQDSQITTSVLGLQGNGGDINITSDYLIMDSGFIQANTAARGASGGAVNVNVGTIIPSGSLLFVGGNAPFRFQPYSGINVIQAAAPDGIKGQVNVTTPQLNLSGTLSSLILQSFDQNALSRDLCAIGTSSSLSQSGKGGLRRRAKDALLSTTF